MTFTCPNALGGGTADPTYGYPINDIAYNEFDNYGDGPASYPWPAGEWPHMTPHPWSVLIGNYNRTGTATDVAKGNKIHHNKVIFRGTGLGMGVYDGTTTKPVWNEPTNEWHHNVYYVQDLNASPGQWMWGNATQSQVPRTWAEWTGTYSKDSSSVRYQL